MQEKLKLPHLLKVSTQMPVRAIAIPLYEQLIKFSWPKKPVDDTYTELILKTTIFDRN